MIDPAQNRCVALSECSPLKRKYNACLNRSRLSIHVNVYCVIITIANFCVI